MNWLESLLFISASVLSEVRFKNLRWKNAGWQEEEGSQAKQAQNNQAGEQAIIYSEMISNGDEGWEWGKENVEGKADAP